MNLLIAGSFDPITIGHVDLINRARRLCDNLHINIGNNAKQNMFSFEDRKRWIEKVANNCIITQNQGMTIDYLFDNKISGIVRGVRSYKDFEYEQEMHDRNELLFNTTLPFAPELKLETIVLFAKPAYRCISSSAVRTLLKNDTSDNILSRLEQFVPYEIAKDILKKFEEIT